MKSRICLVIALAALAICLSCQAVEMFDQWDHTVQTGNDTEYTFVVLALCVGVTYSLRWFAPEISQPDASTAAPSHSTFDSMFSRAIQRASAVLVPASPPSVSLRI